MVWQRRYYLMPQFPVAYTYIRVSSPWWLSLTSSSVVRSVGNCAWWRHQMETFSALLAICAGNSPVIDEFPAQRPVTRSFDVFFDLCPNKWLSKQSWGWWFETLSRPLWRYCNVCSDDGSVPNFKTCWRVNRRYDLIPIVHQSSKRHMMQCSMIQPMIRLKTRS